MAGMTGSRFEAGAARVARSLRRRLADDLSRLADDAGITPTELARAAALNRSYVSRTLDGLAQPTLETYARLAAVLGADLSARLYPNTGPAIRDRHQATIVEGLLAQLHPRWQSYPEVRVREPARGWIDLALHDMRASLAVATEVQSELRRIEQLLRWTEEKAASLPSWDGWVALRPAPAISRLLIVRRTRATRAVANEYARLLSTAYPAHPDDAVAALTGTTPWPGPALVWVALDARRMRFVSGR